MAMASTIEKTPACIEMREPHTTRERPSRPRSSVPKGCAHDGGLRILLQSVRTGSMLAIHGARALGAGTVRVMGRHILPNIVSAILVQATVAIPTAIIAEAVLSFLGLGVQPPRPSWGTMLNAAQQFLETAPGMAIWPGLAIFVLALSFNLAGDGLRDLLDPRDY